MNLELLSWLIALLVMGISYLSWIFWKKYLDLKDKLLCYESQILYMESTHDSAMDAIKEDLKTERESKTFQLESMRESYDKNIREARKDSSKRASAITKGKISEHFVPFMGKFPWNPSDCKFFGDPIDFIVFDGVADTGTCKGVIFLEVKTGNSRLSKKERSIKDAINAGNVSYEEVRLDKDLKIGAIKKIRTNKKGGKNSG